MGSKWTVQPDDDKVDLTWDNAPGGPASFWVRFKKQLTVGEDRHVKTAGWRGVSRQQQAPGDDAPPVSEIQIDWRAVSVVRVLVWLTDWSLTDDKDRKLALKRDVIEALHADLFDVIETALTAHVEAMEAVKKTPNSPASSTPSPQAT